jgi:hypothetical protein
MPTLISRSPFGSHHLRSTHTPVRCFRPSWLPWANFTLCPHCRTNRRCALLARPDESVPIVSRSDGVNFHLVLGGKPIEYPAKVAKGKTGMMSVGFWYVHEANGGLTESVVVLLRKPPRREPALLVYLDRVADKLHNKPCRSALLPPAYEFDGIRLHEVPSVMRTTLVVTLSKL